MSAQICQGIQEQCCWSQIVVSILNLLCDSIGVVILLNRSTNMSNLFAKKTQKH